MLHVYAGLSVTLFGLVAFLGPLLTGRFIVDYTALAAIVFGSRVLKGHRNAAAWGMVVMAWYVVAPLLILTAGHLYPEWRRVSGRTPTSEEWRLAVLVLLPAAAWVALNFELLRRVRRSTAPRSRSSDGAFRAGDPG